MILEQPQDSIGLVLGVEMEITDQQTGAALPHAGQLELGQVAIDAVIVFSNVFDGQPSAGGSETFLVRRTQQRYQRRQESAHNFDFLILFQRAEPQSTYEVCPLSATLDDLNPVEEER